MQLTVTQVQDAEQRVLSVLEGAKGRGKAGLDQQQLLELNAAIEMLEEDGGVPGGSFCLQGPRLQHVVDGCVVRLDPASSGNAVGKSPPGVPGRRQGKGTLSRLLAICREVRAQMQQGVGVTCVPP